MNYHSLFEYGGKWHTVVSFFCRANTVKPYMTRVGFRPRCVVHVKLQKCVMVIVLPKTVTKSDIQTRDRLTLRASDRDP